MILKLKKRVRRLREWLNAGRLAGKRVKIMALLRYWYGPSVDSRSWRARIRVCRRCPLFEAANRRCHREVSDGILGCGCWVPAVAKMPEPYQGPGGMGCWGRAAVGPGFGWGPVETGGVLPTIGGNKP